jgi:hypothetical protein
MLTEFLANRDEACPGCKYNLRGLVGDRCPECNQQIALRIALTEPRLGGFLAALVGLSTGAGFNGLLAAYGLIVFGSRGSSPGPFLQITGIGTAVFSGAIFFLLRRRNAFRRMSSAWRFSIIVLCWLLVVASFITFTTAIR